MDVTQMAAWPQDERNEGGDEELGRLLMARVRGSEARLAAMEAEHQRILASIEHERRLMEHANALLHDLGLVPAPTPAQPAPVGSSNGAQSASAPNTAFVAGNRSEKAPKRRPEYEAMSLTGAVRRLLSSGEPMSIDQLADAIYDIQDAEQRHAAKGSLRSSLAGGADRGFWGREAPGVFRMERKEPEL